jgi:hypothetical protein
MFAPLFVLFNMIAMSVDGHQVHRSPYILKDTAVFDDTIMCMPSFTYYTLSLMAIVPISMFASIFITSHLYKRNLLAIIGAAFNKNQAVENDTDTESEPEPEETPEEKYVKSHPIKRATHDPPKHLDELKYTIMVETTPRGVLIMCYNCDTEGFEYWSDADIPLTMLETAARRYVTEYNCKGFYLPRKKTNVVDNEEPVKIETTTEESEQEVEVEENEDDDIFLKRKKTPSQLKLEKQIAEEEKVTRFIKKGKLIDFKPKELFKGMNFDEQIVKKKLDYSTFKKAMNDIMTDIPDYPAIVGSLSRQDYAAIRDAHDAKIV